MALSTPEEAGRFNLDGITRVSMVKALLGALNSFRACAAPRLRQSLAALGFGYAADFAKGGAAMLMLGVKQGSASNRPSPRGVVRSDHFGFGCTANPGWRGRSAGAFVGRSTPGCSLSGLQPEEPCTDGPRHQAR